MKRVLLLVLICLCVSCKTSKTTNVYNYSSPLPIGTEIKVLGLGQKVYDNAKLLGSIKIGDTGVTLRRNCTYQKVLSELIEEARKMGGNLVHIIEHKEPGFSSCHRIKGDVYLVK